MVTNIHLSHHSDMPIYLQIVAQLTFMIETGALSADALIERYCALLYARSKSYVEVARITGLDRRTAKKYVARREET